MQVWQIVGAHRYCTDGDTVFWHLIGVMDELQIERLLEAVDGALSQFHQSVLLVDCTLAHSLKPEARRRYGEWLKHNPHQKRASIFFCASGEMRTFLLLAQRSAELVSGRRSAIEIVVDEATARRRADELRALWTPP